MIRRSRIIDLLKARQNAPPLSRISLVFSIMAIRVYQVLYFMQKWYLNIDKTSSAI